MLASVFFFQAEDGIRDLVRSRGLGDVYKRQLKNFLGGNTLYAVMLAGAMLLLAALLALRVEDKDLSLIHI